MKKLYLFAGIISITCHLCPAQASDTLQCRIVLVGDAGALLNGHQPVIQAIKKNILLDEKTVVLYLGDNLYKVGLPDDAFIGYQEARVVLDSQVSIVKNTLSRAYMIPGNHDWNNGGPGGYQAVVREQFYVDLLDTKNIFFYPKGGCPGPVELSLTPDITLVIIDSQWWLHPYDKPGIESDCPYKTNDEVLSQLNDILIRNYKKLVILATHHTFRSNGIHGGYYGVKQHIFPFTDLYPKWYIPLPVIGSIYPISRGVFGSPQDLKYPAYQNMIHDIELVTKTHPNVIFAAGHEHSLQLIKDTGHYYIVTGSGYNSSRVSKSRKTLYASPEHGFALLEISTNKNVKISFYLTGPDSTHKAFTKDLLNFSKLPDLPKDTTKPISVWKDNAVVAAGNRYGHASKFQRLILGKNYRKEWTTPVTMRIFNISKEQGGFKIVSLGGGKQTKSLKLEDKDGNEWALRSVDKDPEKAIPENFRNTVAQDIVQDLISAANPYAALTIPTLANAAGVLESKPTLFFVPDDPALGYYRQIFANTVCMLEEKDPVPDQSKIKSSDKVLAKMAEDNHHVVDQHAVLRARLLDILIADFDRHFDQWKWAESDTGKGKIYIPIAKDRDQAYFYSDGLFMRYVTRNRMPFLKGLHYNIPRVNWLGYVARDFDRFFLNQLDANDWNKTIAEFRHNVSDSVINEAMKHFPAEIYPMDANVISKKLISRRNLLQREGMRYYRFLSKYVNVVGSNQDEYFKVMGTDSGLHVIVYSRNSKGDTTFKMFDRSFASHNTHELRLYGLNGNDIFDVDKSAGSKIRLRIIGGKGNDTFNIKGRTRNYLYDLNSEKNYVQKGQRTKQYFSNDVHVNDYNRVEFKYPTLRFPRISLGFNVEDGLFLGPSFWMRSYAFRKEPYAIDQKVSFLYAPQRGAYQAKYAGEFNHLIKNIDLVVDGELVNPVLNNFFGLGNETKFQPDIPVAFYRVRYKYVEGDVFLRRKFFDKLSISIGPTVYHYWNKYRDNVNRILGHPSILKLDSAEVYTNQFYAGGKFVIDLYNLNSELFPTRGIHWNTQFTYLDRLTGKSQSLTKLTSDMVVYASMASPAKTVAVLRFGAGHIFSQNFEYFQALNLGANNFLRGFRKNRFSGNTLFYNSIELRQKLFQSRWYVVPGDFGLIAFNDLGRVWYRGEHSNKWHDAYGAGFYYVPFNMVIVSATINFSDEEHLFNFSIGTKVNITF